MQTLTYNVIGLMSGTSLDGLDIAFCKFQYSENKRWKWDVLNCDTVSYPEEIKSQLMESKTLSGLDLHLLDVRLGTWMGKEVKNFIDQHQLAVDLIASHGHTVFHDPEKQLSVQIGNSNFIHAITNRPVIADFRNLDIAKGGQGAPLVPVGDRLLFSEYDVCLNLGGIANFSFEDRQGSTIAYDIGVCNILLNHLASLKGLEYDDKGEIAEGGEVLDMLLEKWSHFSFLKLEPPKSLGSELIEREILTEINENLFQVENMMATAVEHISEQIAIQVKRAKDSGKILITGGGAFNEYLVKQMQLKLGENFELVVGNQKTVNYKEALIFAFLGVLNARKECNTLASVTGAPSDSVSGQKLGDI